MDSKKRVKGRYYSGIGSEKKVLIRNLSKSELTKFMKGPVFNQKTQKKMKEEGIIF